MNRKLETDVSVEAASNGPHAGTGDGSKVAVPATRPSWLPRALEQLRAMHNVPENWDGYHGDAPRAESIEAATNFLFLVISGVSLPPPFISPTRIGGILIEWEQDCHELEVEIDSPDVASYVYLNTRTAEEASGEFSPVQGPPEPFLTLATRLQTV